MLTTVPTGKPPKPSKVFFPKEKMPLLFAEMAKAGIILPAAYVTPENFVGLLDTAVMTYLAAKGEGDGECSYFNSLMEEELGDGDQVEEAQDRPI